MFVIIDNNDNNRIIIGPMEWKPKYFSFALSEEYDQEITVNLSDQSLVPYEVIPGVFIRECDTSYSSIDPETQDYAGPSWTLHANGSATAAWVATDKALHNIKGFFNNQAASERYKKEVTPFKITIDGTEYTQGTAREDRSIFTLLLAYVMKPNIPIYWKFQEGFVLLNKQSIEALLNTYNDHIQTNFVWEKDKITAVNNSTTKEEIKAIEIKVKPGPVGNG